MPRILLFSLVTLALAGCRPTKLAGESLGQYRVTGTLDETTCGAGHPAPETMTFYVELRAQPGSSVGYWKLPNAPIVDGDHDEDEGSFRFEHRTQHVGVPQDLPAGVVGCTLERAEIVTVQLEASATDGGASDAGDAGVSDPSAFTGRTTIGITPVLGSECSRLLLPFGGAFPVLPCEIRYDLEGEQVDEPIW